MSWAFTAMVVPSCNSSFRSLAVSLSITQKHRTHLLILYHFCVILRDVALGGIFFVCTEQAGTFWLNIGLAKNIAKVTTENSPGRSLPCCKAEIYQYTVAPLYTGHQLHSRNRPVYKEDRYQFSRPGMYRYTTKKTICGTFFRYTSRIMYRYTGGLTVP